MTQLVLTTRPLPLPKITANGETVTFEVVDASKALGTSARVLCSTAMDAVDADFIARLPKSVGLIANLGVGTDNIDLVAAKKRNILVSNTPVVTEDTADLAFALLLASARKITQSANYTKSGKWAAHGVAPELGIRVHGKTLGLVGFGAIGQAVARRAVGFGMTVFYWNRSSKPKAETTLGAQRIDNLKELFAQSDFISLHTPLTPETRKLIDKDVLASVKAGAILINTARGEVLEEAALVETLQAGGLAGAALDVFENEPNICSDIIALEQVLTTPHIGSATAECRLDIVRCGLRNIVQYLETGTVEDAVSA